MILLRNEREIVMIERWEDILSRPGFEPRLDPKEHKLADAIGTYTLGPTVPCGPPTADTSTARATWS
jgi:hypothetical protein